VVTREVEAHLLLDARAQVAEGPTWDVRDGRLLWVDIPRGLLHCTDVDSGRDDQIEVGQDIGVAIPRAGGGYVAAVRQGFIAVSDRGDITRLAGLERPGIRMNDGQGAPDGSFWAGTMSYDKTPGAGSLYRLDPSGEVHVRLTGVTISNGLAFGADDRVYYVDTPTRRVDVFDLEVPEQTLTNRRPLLLLPEGVGNPDGIALDDEGGLWVALWGGGAVHRYLPDGALDVVVRVPVSRVTSCCFAGPGDTRLYITTARQGATTDELAAQPHAGGIFSCDVGVTGPAAVPYAG
jgi:sugar lactone lactonase YvrE